MGGWEGRAFISTIKNYKGANKMGNININIPDDLHKKLRIKKALTGKDIDEMVTEAIERTVADVKIGKK